MSTGDTKSRASKIKSNCAQRLCDSVNSVIVYFNFYVSNSVTTDVSFASFFFNFFCSIS